MCGISGVFDFSMNRYKRFASSFSDALEKNYTAEVLTVMAISFTVMFF
jgi:hypothetical protein